MANQEDLRRLTSGVPTWNRSWAEQPAVRPDLCETDLCRADLREADLPEADVRGAN